MITDRETNWLYLADSLPVKYKSFTRQLEDVLLENSIPLNYLPFTKDVWAVDFMPIQVRKDRFIQFRYNPDYLQTAKKWRNTISDVDQIVNTLGIDVIKSEIVLDGGNVIRWKDKAIMCDKVFKENLSYNEKELIRELENLFEVDKLIFVPQDPNDIIGHADGMVRFLDGETVLINDYSKEKNFQLSFKTSLLNAGLDFEVIPYNPYNNKTFLQANGTYINYLQMKQAIFIPVFGIEEDTKAIKAMENYFPDFRLIPVDSSEIANEGGVLNCVSWNILR